MTDLRLAFTMKKEIQLVCFFSLRLFTGLLHFHVEVLIMPFDPWAPFSPTEVINVAFVVKETLENVFQDAQEKCACSQLYVLLH